MLLCISQLQYNMLLVDEPNSLQMGLISFCVFTFVLKSLSLLGGLNSKAGKHTIVSLQWLMLANTFKPSLCDRSTAGCCPNNVASSHFNQLFRYKVRSQHR